MEQKIPVGFHVMAKPTGALCNLACKYCFYLPREELYPEGSFCMSYEVMQAYIRQIIESSSVPNVNIAWQGGEPTLMGLDFFRRSIEYQQQFIANGVKLDNSIQTNGILLDDEWCEFLKQHNFLVGISLDGPPELHDAFRVDKGSKATSDKVLHSIELMNKHGVEYNILCTINSANANHPLDVYKFFRDNVGAQFIQFIPIVEHKDGAVFDWCVSPEQYGRFLIDIFDEWLHRDVGSVFVMNFDWTLAKWVGSEGGACVSAKSCGRALALEHNGDLYSCDHFVTPDHLLGNILDRPIAEMVESEKQLKFGSDKFNTLPKYCRECEFLFACNGECPKNRFTQTPDGEPGLNYLCDGFKAFFKHIDRPMNMISELLSRGMPASTIMQLLEREELELKAKCAKAGRNEPCPCGSGQKFKRCHGRIGN